MCVPAPGGPGVVHATYGRTLQIVSFVSSLTADQSTAFGPFNVEGYRQIRLQARADVAAAAANPVLDQTMDGTNYDMISNATGAITPPSGGFGYSVVADAVGQGCRVRYVNGATSQAASALRIIAYCVP